eukprot:CCRYP_013068-RA/>CCRYP_013068-RA protein AED:0.19 eAED:0.19 QI:0/-1/0/1/-1/1/1/0/670
MTPPPTTSRIRRRIETLACTVCLVTTVHAQRQHYPPRPLEHPTGDPLHDGILIRPIRLEDDDSWQPQKFVVFDFKPAFPPYTREALNDLLLLRDREGDDGEIDGSTEPLQTNETLTRSGDTEKATSDAHETMTTTILQDEMGIDVVDTDAAVNEVQDDAHDLETEAARDEAEKVPPLDEVEDISDSKEDDGNNDAIDVETSQTDVSTNVSTASETIADDGFEPISSTLDESDSQQPLVLTEDQTPSESLEEQSEHREDNNDDQPTELTLTDFTSPENHDEILTNAPDSIQTENEAEVIQDVPEGPMTSSPDGADANVTPIILEVRPNDVQEHSAENHADVADTTPPQDDGVPAIVAEEDNLPDEHHANQKDTSSADDGYFRDDNSKEHPTSRTDDEIIPTDDKIAIAYDESPPLSNLQYKDEDANREFVTGLDEIDKLFESVSPPDELDVGADGSSIQDVLVGQGLKIIFKRAKSFGSSVKERFEKIVEKALPQQLMILTGDHGEDGDEEESLEDIFKLLKSDVPLGDVKVIDDSIKNQKDNMDENGESLNDQSHNTLQERFPLLKTKQANKLWKYARRKWEQAKHLFDEFFAIFEGHGDDDEEEDIDFNSELGRMNYDDMRSLIEKNSLNRKDGPQFGMEVDDSFVRSRYDAMMKLREKNIQARGGDEK